MVPLLIGAAVMIGMAIRDSNRESGSSKSQPVEPSGRRNNNSDSERSERLERRRSAERSTESSELDRKSGVDDTYRYSEWVGGTEVLATNRGDLQRGIETAKDLRSNPKWANDADKVKRLYAERNPTNGKGQPVLGHSFGGGWVTIDSGLNRKYRAQVAAHEQGHKLGMDEREADEYAGLPQNPSDWDQ
jgi:hypothetical protein